MEKIKCSICGYTYKTEIGDEENGIAAGTTWENLPEDWCCPICNLRKAEFYRQKVCEKCA